MPPEGLEARQVWTCARGQFSLFFSGKESGQRLVVMVKFENYAEGVG